MFDLRTSLRQRSGAVCLAVAVFVAAPQFAQARSTTAPPPLPAPSGTIVNVSTEAQLQAAVQKLASNTTIVIAAGTYKLTSTLWINGTFTNVALRGATNNRDDVVLQGPGMTNTATTVPQFGIWTGGNVQGATIANLTVRDFPDHPIVFNAGTQSPRVYNAHLINAGQQFVKANPNPAGGGVNNGIVEYSVIEYTTTAKDSYTNGVDIHTGNNWIVRNNLFRNIVAPAGQLAGPAVLSWNYSTNTLTEGNTFINCARGIAYGLENKTGFDHSGGIIRNNFFYRSSAQPGDAAILVYDSPNTQVLNNTVLVSGTYASPIEYRFTDTTGTVLTNNLTDGTILARDGATGTLHNNVTTATPALFVNPSAGDLHLLSTAAAAIDKGLATTNATDDWDGQARPQGAAYDIGADEYVTATTTTTYRISGKVANATGTAVSGVTMTLSGATSTTATTDTTGAYSFSGLTGGGNYTVAPSKSLYAFTPANASYTSLSANQTANFTADQRPTVSLTAPAAGATFTAPATVKMTATASDPDGTVTKVQFYAGATLVGTATTAPYSLNWNATTAGTYALKAIATDNTGATKTSSAVSVTITTATSPAPAAPTVALTSPAAGSTFTAPALITFAANASESGGTISKVDFYSGSTLIGTSTTAPYSLRWSSVGAGAYSLTALATDGKGVTARSAAVGVTVSTASNVAPTVSLTAPSNNSTFTAPATVTLSASAGDSDGTVTKVAFYSGSTLIGTATAAPYSATWSNVAAGSYSLTAIATDNGGATTTSTAVAITVGAAPTPAPTGGLVTSLVEVGKFTVPNGDFGSPAGDGFNYGGTAIAWNPVKQDLYVVGHDYDQMTAEISVPASGTATVVHNFVDVTDGRLGQIGSGTAKIGGHLFYNNRWYATGFLYYDATNSQTVSHFVRNGDLSATGAVTGPFRAGTMGAGFYSGYMALVPSALQASLGGPALTGNCCLSIISRTSYGPAAFAFDPENLGAAIPLVYYPQSNQTLGAYGASGSNPVFNGTTRIKGLVVVPGTDSVLFIGRTGTGPYCYGEAATCGDPTNNSKGEHAYPYAMYVWAYDARDLAQVRAGQRQPWTVVPYKTWAIPGLSGDSEFAGGATIDPATGRIFIAEPYGNGTLPVIHVFKAQ